MICPIEKPDSRRVAERLAALDQALNDTLDVLPFGHAMYIPAVQLSEMIAGNPIAWREWQKEHRDIDRVIQGIDAASRAGSEAVIVDILNGYDAMRRLGKRTSVTAHQPMAKSEALDGNFQNRGRKTPHIIGVPCR